MDHFGEVHNSTFSKENIEQTFQYDPKSQTRLQTSGEESVQCKCKA